MVFTRKFSQFVPGAAITAGDEPVGLRNDVNTIWDFIQNGNGGSVVQTIDTDTTGLTVGDWVRVNYGIPSPSYVPALADNAGDAEVAGVVLQIVSPTQFLLQQAGYIPSGTPGFTGFTDGVYFLDDTIPGAQNILSPTTNGFVSKPVFLADDVDSGWVICLMRGIIIGTPAPIPAIPETADTNIYEVNQPGNTFLIGDWVSISADGVYSLADATTFTLASAAGVVIEAGDPIFTVQFSGHNENTVTSAVNSTGTPIGITAATTYYISEIVPGAICPTPPLIPTAYSKPAFLSESAINGTGLVLPQRPLQDASSGSGGAIIQVVSNLFRSPIGPIVVPAPNPPGSFVPLGLATTITPSSLNNLIKVSFNVKFSVGGTSNFLGINFYLYRNGVLIANSVGTTGGPTQIPSTCSTFFLADNTSTSSSDIGAQFVLDYMDNPVSISPLTYEIYAQGITGNTTSNLFLNISQNNLTVFSTVISTVFLEEVAQ
jgi:hypothetical protein